MAKNPLIRKYDKKVNGPLLNKSAGILDDHAVRKVIATKEGSITRTPTADFDIANKKYVDDTAGGGGFWSRVVTTLSPTTAGDNIETTGTGTFEGLTPYNNGTADLGSVAFKWRSLFLSENITMTGNITLGGTVDGIDIATDVGANNTHRADVTGDPHNIEADTLTFTNKTIDDFSNHIEADEIHEELRNESGASMTRGDAVYISGFSVGQVRALVTLADSSVVGTMPMIALLEDATLANNSTGHFIEQGTLKDMDTDSWNVGDELYISETGTTTNTLTATKPTGTALIQKVAVVLRKHASNGVVEIFGAGRQNDLPNLPNTKIWIGDASGVPQEFVLSGHATMTAGGVVTTTGLKNVVEDTTPELGGEMDAGAHTIGFTQQTATGDGTTTIDWKLGNKFYFTFGAQNDTFTFTAPTNPCNLILVLKQDGVGSRIPTFPGTVLWSGGSMPTFSTGVAAVDIVAFYYDGTNYFGVETLNFS